MGATESFLGVDKEDYTNFLLTGFISIFAYYGAFQPIWHRYTWRSEYFHEKNIYKKWLLNPRVWYDNTLWFTLFFFAGVALYRFLRVLRVSSNSNEIFIAEIGIWLYSIQIGIHGTWAIYNFYWKQPFWSIFTMGVAALFSIGVFVIALLVDPYWSGFSYAPYTIAQIIFTGANGYLYVKSWDAQKRIEFPSMLYWKHGLYPINMKRL